MKTGNSTFKVGSLVWAKMKGFPPWPGRVANPPENCAKAPRSKSGPSRCIFFFGSNNFAWIEEIHITHYDDEKNKGQLSKTNKPGLKEAITAIEEYIKANGMEPKETENNVEAEFDKLKSSEDDVLNVTTETPKTPKAKKERKRKSKDVRSVTPEAKKRKDVDRTANSPPVTSLPILNHTGISGILRRSPGALIQRSSTYAAVVQVPDLDVGSVSQTLRDKNIQPSALKFGFLGLGVMGQGIVKNLLNSGHTVYVWNRTTNKCDKFVEAGAVVAQTPSDVIDACDITFSCVSNPSAANDMVFGNCGVMSAMNDGKGYVEMTSIDPSTSISISETIIQAGGRYLEAQIQGSRSQSEEGTLVLLASGDRTLFDDCQSCFEAMSKHSYFLGDVGNATRMNLILNMINGIALAGLAEGLALADRNNVNQNDMMEIFGLTQVCSPLLKEKGRAIIEGGFPTHMPLAHMQKDLRLCLSLGDSSEQPLPLCATTNEIFKHAKRLGYSEHDVSAVYIRARF